MKVHELVTPESDALLYHPTIGYVRWAPEWKGSPSRHMVFALGREKGNPLVVDSAVLFDDCWRQALEEELV